MIRLAPRTQSVHEDVALQHVLVVFGKVSGKACVADHRLPEVFVLDERAAEKTLNFAADQTAGIVRRIQVTKRVENLVLEIRKERVDLVTASFTAQRCVVAVQ